MDLLQDQESRKSPSDHSTDSFEQLESLVSREDELQPATGNLLDAESVPKTSAANQNLNLDLLTEETGEGLPLNMQLSMTASDHSTPEASKPGIAEEVKEVSKTESAANKPGGGDAIVPSPSLPQSEEIDENFYQFEGRYESKKQEETYEEKIIEQDEPEVMKQSLMEDEILEMDIIKKELPDAPSPLTKSFTEEDQVHVNAIAPEVLQARIEEEVKREIASVQREVLEKVDNGRKIVEEPKVQSVQSAVLESPPPPVIPDPINNQEEKEDHPVVDCAENQPASSFSTSSPPIQAPFSFSPGPEPKSETFKSIPEPSVKASKPIKAVMDEAAPQDCPFKSIGNYFVRENLNPQLADLVFWKDPKKSGIAFGIGLVILFSLACCSVISVVSYTALTILTGSLGFRIYKSILQAVQKTNDGHPFKEYLELEVTLPNDRVHQIVDIAVKHVNATILKLRSVFLAEDIIDSLKFVALFWCLTYIGSWFNGLTLIILAYLGAFSLPKVYEMHQAQIDQVLDMVCKQVSDVTNMVKSKIPFPAQKDKKQ